MNASYIALLMQNDSQNKQNVIKLLNSVYQGFLHGKILQEEATILSFYVGEKLRMNDHHPVALTLKGLLCLYMQPFDAGVAAEHFLRAAQMQFGYACYIIGEWLLNPHIRNQNDNEQTGFRWLEAGIALNDRYALKRFSIECRQMPVTAEPRVAYIKLLDKGVLAQDEALIIERGYVAIYDRDFKKAEELLKPLIQNNHPVLLLKLANKYLVLKNYDAVYYLCQKLLNAAEGLHNSDTICAQLFLMIRQLNIHENGSNEAVILAAKVQIVNELDEMLKKSPIATTHLLRFAENFPSIRRLAIISFTNKQCLMDALMVCQSDPSELLSFLSEVQIERDKISRTNYAQIIWDKNMSHPLLPALRLKMALKSYVANPSLFNNVIEGLKKDLAQLPYVLPYCSYNDLIELIERHRPQVLPFSEESAVFCEALFEQLERHYLQKMPNTLTTRFFNNYYIVLHSALNNVTNLKQLYDFQIKLYDYSLSLHPELISLHVKTLKELRLLLLLDSFLDQSMAPAQSEEEEPLDQTDGTEFLGNFLM